MANSDYTGEDHRSPAPITATTIKRKSASGDADENDEDILPSLVEKVLCKKFYGT